VREQEITVLTPSANAVQRDLRLHGLPVGASPIALRRRAPEELAVSLPYDKIYFTPGTAVTLD
jgi:hypothetical protein